MITVEKGSLVVKSLSVHQQTLRLLLTKISLLVMSASTVLQAVKHTLLELLVSVFASVIPVLKLSSKALVTMAVSI